MQNLHIWVMMGYNYTKSLIITLTMLSKRDANVSATIYTRQLSNQQQLDITRHNQQYPPIEVNICQ